jgi:toxin ParE1/3/4
MGARAAGEFRLTPLAERDLEDIWYFTVETWSQEQAEKYHADMLRAFRELAFGRVGGRDVDLRRGYLKYPVGSHFVFYRIRPFGIEVVRILHKRMDVSLHLPG